MAGALLVEQIVQRPWQPSDSVPFAVLFRNEPTGSVQRTGGYIADIVHNADLGLDQDWRWHRLATARELPPLELVHVGPEGPLEPNFVAGQLLETLRVSGRERPRELVLWLDRPTKLQAAYRRLEQPWLPGLVE